MLSFTFILRVASAVSLFGTRAGPSAKRHPHPQLRSPGFCMLRKAPPGGAGNDRRPAIANVTATATQTPRDRLAACAYRCRLRRDWTRCGDRVRTTR